MAAVAMFATRKLTDSRDQLAKIVQASNNLEDVMREAEGQIYSMANEYMGKRHLDVPDKQKKKSQISLLDFRK